MLPLVLIPGLGSDAAIWQRTIAALGNDAHCIVGDTLQDPTLAAMAQRILDHAPDRFALTGVSMGGMVAMELMRLAPSRVTHLALVDTNARPDGFGRKLSRRLTSLVVAMASDFRPLVKRGIPALVHPDTADDVRAEIEEMSLRVGADAYIRQTRAVRMRPDLRGGLPAITIPTAVIVGREDTLLPVELSKEIHDLIPGSTFHVIPDCGHLPPIEKPEIMAGLLHGLIGGRLTAH
jgi:pimeloyl-ACP methyl ester carboxylesterase